MSVLTLLEQGGMTIIPLGICSVLVVAVVLERIWLFSRVGKIPQDLFHRVESLLASRDWRAGLRLLEETRSPYANIAKTGMMHETSDPNEIRDLLTMACEEEILAASKTLPILGTIGNIAPFIGLFGTVLGIMRAFHEVANQGTAGASAVSGGIAEALIATALGLGVGIIAVVANNWCLAWVERYRLNLERFATQWAYRLQHNMQDDLTEVTEIAR